MKLINSIGPNPRIVRMFIAEKGVDVPFEDIDILSGANRKEDFVAKNPAGQVPAMETDSGLVIAEVPVICDYIEEKFPENPLFGSTPEEKAETRMWARRIDTQIILPMTLGFRYGEGKDFFSGREPIFEDSSANMKELAQIKLGWFNDLLEGKQFVCGDRFSFADIALFCFLEFGNTVGQPVDQAFTHIVEWMDRIGQRPSAAASA